MNTQADPSFCNSQCRDAGRRNIENRKLQIENRGRRQLEFSTVN
jgi:hypothetical protein